MRSTNIYCLRTNSHLGLSNLYPNYLTETNRRIYLDQISRNDGDSYRKTMNKIKEVIENDKSKLQNQESIVLLYDLRVNIPNNCLKAI